MAILARRLLQRHPLVRKPVVGHPPAARRLCGDRCGEALGHVVVQLLATVLCEDTQLPRNLVDVESFGSAEEQSLVESPHLESLHQERPTLRQVGDRQGQRTRQPFWRSAQKPSVRGSRYDARPQQFPGTIDGRSNRSYQGISLRRPGSELRLRTSPFPAYPVVLEPGKPYHAYLVRCDRVSGSR